MRDIESCYHSVLTRIQEEEVKSAKLGTHFLNCKAQNDFAQKALQNRKSRLQASSALANSNESHQGLGLRDATELAALSTCLSRLQRQFEQSDEKGSNFDQQRKKLPNGSRHIADINCELKRTVLVTFLGSSAVRIPVAQNTLFGNVLSQALLYFGLPSAGALLVDLHHCAWPLAEPVRKYFASDFTPPYAKLIQRKYSSVPRHKLNVSQPTLSGLWESDAKVERQGLLRTESNEPTGLTQRTCVDYASWCSPVLILLHALQLVSFIALSLVFIPVDGGASVRSVVEETLFAQFELADGRRLSFETINSEADFWTWLTGPVQDHLGASFVPDTHESVCIGTDFPHYVGNATHGHYCATIKRSIADLCNGTVQISGCQIISGLESCVTLPVCVSSFGAFAFRGLNALVGPVRLRQHRVAASDCTTGLLNPTREFAGHEENAMASNVVTELCDGPLAAGSQAIPTDPGSMTFTGVGVVDSSSWTCSDNFRESDESRLDQYLYPFGVGGAPTVSSACTLAVNIVPSPSIFAAALTELEDGQWIDQFTRRLELEFNLYNPSLDLAVTVEASCSVLTSSGYACQRSVQTMPVLLPFQQFEAERTGFTWLSPRNWTVVGFLLAFFIFNMGFVGFEVCLYCQLHPKCLLQCLPVGQGIACRGCGATQSQLTRSGRFAAATSVMLAGRCCNVFVWLVEILLITSMIVKLSCWGIAAQTFMLEVTAENAQMRFSTSREFVDAFSDLSVPQTFVGVSSVFDALCVWGLMLLTLKYFQVTVFSSFLLRTTSLACDALTNVVVVFGVLFGSCFVVHYFLVARASLRSPQADFSFLQMLSLSTPSAAIADGKSDPQSVVLSPFSQGQVFAGLAELLLTVLLSLLSVPILGSIVVGVTLKFAELVDTDGFYWLVPAHLLLEQWETAKAYSRVFRERKPKPSNFA